MDLLQRKGLSSFLIIRRLPNKVLQTRNPTTFDARKTHLPKKICFRMKSTVLITIKIYYSYTFDKTFELCIGGSESDSNDKEMSDPDPGNNGQMLSSQSTNCVAKKTAPTEISEEIESTPESTGTPSRQQQVYSIKSVLVIVI